jgi:hypothetical protein
MESNFIWDLGKEAANVQKHKVDFKTAMRAFSDPHRKIFFDEKHSCHEDRFFCVGKIMGRTLTVRFVYRDNKIRIIGAGFWRKGARYYEKEENSG